jgi:peptidyl-prolyl cis-trans isomerase A (cyclophilin A)
MRIRLVLLAAAVSLAGADSLARADKPAVRAPVAGDLARYTRGIKGKGPLLVSFVTNQGTIRCQLFEKKVPVTVANFVGLARGKHTWKHPDTGKVMRGKPLYNGTQFHRVIPDFMIQGGDPQGTGRGGPGYRFADETRADLKHDRAGILSMANAGPDTNGSQFFITDKATPWLDGRHTVFGQCADLSVIRAIARVPTGAGNKPTSPVVLKKVRFRRGTPPAMPKVDAPVAAKPATAKRTVTAADKATVKKILHHFGNLADIHELIAEKDADLGLTKLSDYLAKHGTEIKKLTSQLEAMQDEVDEAGISELGKLLLSGDAMSRFTQGVQAVANKLADDEARTKRWQSLLGQLM